MSNNQMVSVPPYIGLDPLVGRYYPAQCRRCGWVGSSEELTEDDAQCTRDVGDRLCLGDCDELERHDLLSIIQAMAEQHQGEPVGEVVAFGKGLHEIAWAAGRMPRLGAKLYTHADSAKAERMRADLATVKADRDAYAQNAIDLRAQLAERDALLGAIAGWTTETRAAVLEAFQDELNESASYAWYDAAIADLMKLVEALSASAEPSVPPERIEWRPLTAPGQIQEGDRLSFRVGSSSICARARQIIAPGTDKEEVVYNRKKNHYFVTSMAVVGTSTHKGVLVAKARS